MTSCETTQLKPSQFKPSQASSPTEYRPQYSGVWSLYRTVETQVISGLPLPAYILSVCNSPCSTVQYSTEQYYGYCTGHFGGGEDPDSRRERWGEETKRCRCCYLSSIKRSRGFPILMSSEHAWHIK